MKSIYDKEGFLKVGVEIQEGDLIMRGYQENWPVWSLARPDEFGIRVTKFLKNGKNKLPLYHTVKRKH